MYQDIVGGALHGSGDACNCCCQMCFWLLEVRHFLEMYFCTFFFFEDLNGFKKTYLLCFLVFHADIAILNFWNFIFAIMYKMFFREKYILDLVWYIV